MVDPAALKDPLMEMAREAPPRDELAATTDGPAPAPVQTGTEFPPLSSHWKIDLTGNLVEGDVTDPDRCVFITNFIYRKLADVAVALETDYFDHLTLWGADFQQVVRADNLGVRHAVFETMRTDESAREQFLQWCREQSL